MKTNQQNYQKQAEDFLSKTGATLEIKFLKHGYHFADDKETRDIYECTLSRGSRKYSFNYGQSLVNSGFYYTIGKKITPIDRKYLQPENSKNLIHHIRRESSYQFLNNGKSDVIHYPKEPTAYDILSCLQKYDVGSFDDFCSDFGYDSDSRKAEKIYNVVVNEYTQVCALFTEPEMEEMQEIQ